MSRKVKDGENEQCDFLVDHCSEMISKVVLRIETQNYCTVFVLHTRRKGQNHQAISITHGTLDHYHVHLGFWSWELKINVTLKVLLLSHAHVEWPLGGDKVSMLTHTCPHKPQRKIEVIISNHHADSPLCVWQGLKKYGAECPY